jgi:hypothetical protein
MSLQHAVSAPRFLGFLAATLRRVERGLHWPKSRRSDCIAKLDLSTLSDERLRDLGFLDGRSPGPERRREW